MHKTTIKDIYVVGDSPDSPITDGEFYISWDIYLDYRSWGLKTIMVSIHSITGCFFGEKLVETTNLDGSIEQNYVEFEKEFDQKDWKIETDFDENLPIYPNSLSFDLRYKQVIVEF